MSYGAQIDMCTEYENGNCDGLCELCDIDLYINPHIEIKPQLRQMVSFKD